MYGRRIQKMARPNFFCDIDSLNCLLKMKFDGAYKDIELTMDLIEIPYMFIFTSDEENWTVKAMQRGELYSHNDSGIVSASVVMNKVSGEGKVQTNRELAENMPALLQACRNISSFIQEKGLEELYADLDPEEAGILLSMDGGELKYKVVSGKERPDMMCTTLFGTPTMCRPYMDDFMSRSALEMMSFEDQLEAAEKGDEDAMETVATAYLNGDKDKEIEADPQKAMYWFTKLAEGKNAAAAFDVGLFYAKGFGTERDFAKGAEWMEKAAEYGDDDGLAVAKEYRQTLSDLALAENGDADAQGRLAGFYMALAGSLYQAGNGNDFAESLKWAKLAADGGNGDGLWTLALAYEHGRGVEKNQSTALEYYKQGAENGHAPSMHSLAWCYLCGDVVEKNMRLGFELILRAALLGNGLAMRDAGWCYQFGNGCMGNMRRAVAWYKKALEVINDPELAEKTAHFEMMLGCDSNAEEDYFGEDSDRELTTDEQAFLDKIDAGLSCETKRLLLDPDAAIESYIAALGTGADSGTNAEKQENNSDWAPPAGYMEAMEAFTEAEEYENELAEQGVLPDAPRPGNGVMKLSTAEFPRIASKAEEGDSRALDIISKMNSATEKEMGNGEPKQITGEKLQKLLKNGGKLTGIQQIVTNANGEQYVSTVYGSVSDGLDHSLNVFISSDDIVPFIKSGLNDEDKEGEEEEKKEEKYQDTDGYVMTVDWTDQAVTSVMTVTQEQVQLTLYVRDDRRTNQSVVDSGTWNKQDGNLLITGEALQENKCLIWVVGYAKLRQFLKKEGILEQMKILDNRAAGVMVEIQDGKPTARIVRGKNRPELPCQVFLLGEQMRRPYVDEMMPDMMMSGMQLKDKIAAAENGDPDVMENLAQMYLNGDGGVDQNFKKSAYWWEKLAETGNAIGQFNTGLYYAKGCGVKRDFAKAAEWMKKSAENGDEDATVAAALYDSASDKLKKAETGDAAAQAEVAKLFMQLGGSLAQFGTQNDYAESFKWAQKAAAQGDLEGMYCLALCYEHGRGVKKDIDQAIKYYTRGAEMGNAECQHNLGCYFLRGDHLKKNQKKGFSLCMRSARQGYGLAMKTVGSCYQFGSGVDDDMKKAIEWYEKALKVLDDPELMKKVKLLKRLQAMEERGVTPCETENETLDQIVEKYNSPQMVLKLEGTQHEGRADHCEKLHVGDILKVKRQSDTRLECFSEGQSVGLITCCESVAALLEERKIVATAKVVQCIPKSQRGARARTADVQVQLQLIQKAPNKPKTKKEKTPEEENAAEKRRQKAAEKRRQEEEQRAAEEERLKEQQAECARKSAEVIQLRLEKLEASTAKEEQALKAKAEQFRTGPLAEAKEKKLADETKKRETEQQLDNLGFFKFREKKAARAEIERLTVAIQQDGAQILELETQHKHMVMEVPKQLSDFRQKENLRLTQEYPLPDGETEETRKTKLMRFNFGDKNLQSQMLSALRSRGMMVMSLLAAEIPATKREDFEKNLQELVKCGLVVVNRCGDQDYCEAVPENLVAPLQKEVRKEQERVRAQNQALRAAKEKDRQKYYKAILDVMDYNVPYLASEIQERDPLLQVLTIQQLRCKLGELVGRLKISRVKEKGKTYYVKKR
jgi:TPR repeat protein